MAPLKEESSIIPAAAFVIALAALASGLGSGEITPAELIGTSAVVVVMLLAGVLCYLWVRGVVWLVRRIDRWRHAKERTVWCAGCGEELPVSKAVRIVDVPDDDDEAEMMGGTACVVEYHRRCAPPEVRS